jgi:hypothetical protein
VILTKRNVELCESWKVVINRVLEVEGGILEVVCYYERCACEEYDVDDGENKTCRQRIISLSYIPELTATFVIVVIIILILIIGFLW